MACREVEKVDRRWVEVDVEAGLDTLENCSLVNVVVTGVDNAGGLRPALLRCSNGCPEDSFAATARVARFMSGRLYISLRVIAYQNGWKKPTMPSHCLSCLLPTRPSVATDAVSSQSSTSVFSAS